MLGRKTVSWYTECCSSRNIFFGHVPLRAVVDVYGLFDMSAWRARVRHGHAGAACDSMLQHIGDIIR